MNCIQYLGGWSETHRMVSERLGINPAGDEESARLLSRIINGRGSSIGELERLVKDKPVIVFGSGPGLDLGLEVLRRYRHLLDANGVVLIAADTAVKPLIKQGFRPHVVATDLDGDEVSLMAAAVNGAIMLVHAHGDNMDRVERLVPRLLSMGAKVIGTTQTRPLWNVYNFGGFTDGDRAVHLAVYMGGLRIILIGMDLGPIIGAHSARKFTGNPIGVKRKLIKLQIAEILLSRLACSCPETPIYVFHSKPQRCMVGIGEEELRVLIRN